jgi:hypothetical protein
MPGGVGVPTLLSPSAYASRRRRRRRDDDTPPA